MDSGQVWVYNRAVIVLKRSGLAALLGMAAVIAGAAWPASSHADITLGESTGADGASRSAPGRSGTSEISNRDYLERQESQALDKARRIKDAMRSVAQSLPGAEEKRPAMTGISDGTWYSERLKQIQQSEQARAEEGTKPAGFMERIGEGLDAWATKGVRNERPWEVEKPGGFHPLEGIGKLANQVGETAQGLITMPQLNRTGPAERAPGDRQPSPEPKVGNAAENPQQPAAAAEMRTVAPAPSAPVAESEAAKPAERPARGLLSGRRSQTQPPEVAAPPAPAAPAPRRAEPKTVARSPETPAERVETRAEPRVGNGEEHFELEDVLPPSGSSPGSRFRPGRANRQEVAPEANGGGSDGSLVSRLIGGGGHRASGRGREEVLPEPSGALVADGSLYVVRTGEAEFYPFGAEASAPVPLPAGSVVRVTKGGGEWSGVETQAGKGIIRTDQIRRAHESEAGAERVPARSVEPAKRQALPGSPIPMEIHVKEPEPAKATKGNSRPLGDGLLPPLLEESGR